MMLLRPLVSMRMFHNGIWSKKRSGTLFHWNCALQTGLQLLCHPIFKESGSFIGVEPQRWMAGSLQQEGFRAQLLCKAWRSKIFEVFQLFPFRFDSVRCSCYFRVAIYGTGAYHCMYLFVACRVESPVAPASCEDMLAIFKASKNDRPHHFNWQTKGLQADLQLHRSTRFDRSKELAIAYRKRLPWSIWASEYTNDYSYYRLSGQNQGA